MRKWGTEFNSQNLITTLTEKCDVSENIIELILQETDVTTNLFKSIYVK